MSRPLLLPLACPVCGHDAQGSGASKVFLCLACRRARHMGCPDRAYPFWFAKSRRTGSPQFYAPFWRVEGSASLVVPDPAKGKIYRNMRPLGPLFFPAFWTLRAMHHENLTQRYALMEDPPERDADAEGTVLPGVVDPDNLPAIARLTWLAYLDRVADVTGVEVSFTPASVAYVAVPFLRVGEGWEDGLLGLTFPGAYFSAAHP